MNACATPPKPPRVTWPVAESDDDEPEDAWLDEESPLKKLLRDDDPPEEPRLLLGEDPRDRHSLLACRPDGAAISFRFGSQFSLGISA